MKRKGIYAIAAEVWTSAVTIRFRPLLIGVLCFALSVILLWVCRDALVRNIPEQCIGDMDVFVSWRVLREEAHPCTGSGRVYVLGGSQVMYGFPEQGSTIGPGDVDVWACGMSSPTLMDSFLVLTHLPIDEHTRVFMHTSPSRMVKTELAVPDRFGFLGSDGLVRAFQSRGVDFPRSDEPARWSRQFKTLLMSLHHDLDTDSNVRQYKRDPVGFVASFLFGKQMNTESKSQAPALMDSAVILEVMKDYVESRDGRLYLIEMPYYLDFPKGMAGWSPEEHSDPEVRQRLEHMLRTGNYASARLTDEYYQTVRESGVPLVSFNDQTVYGPEDFIDSMHLTESGRAKFLARFFRAVEQESAGTATDFQ